MNQSKKIFANIPPVVRNLLIINAGVLLVSYGINTIMHIDIARIIGLYYFTSEQFKPFQIRWKEKMGDT